MERYAPVIFGELAAVSNSRSRQEGVHVASTRDKTSESERASCHVVVEARGSRGSVLSGQFDSPSAATGRSQGTLSKIYPQIENVDAR